MAFGQWKPDSGGLTDQRDDLFGSSSGGDSAVAQVQVAKKSGKQHLRDALRDLRDAEDEGQETIVQLDAQREIINKISTNIKTINENVDVADRKIAEMQAPLGLTLGGRKKKKHNVISLNPSSYVASGGRFVMTGWVQKRSKWIRSWNNRFFVIYGDEIFYFNKETEDKERGRIALAGARLQRLDVDEGFGFEIVGVRETIGVRVRKKEDYTSWQNHIQRAIDGRGETDAMGGGGGGGGAAAGGGGYGGGGGYDGGMGMGGGGAAPVSEEDQLLDQIMDSLGNLDGAYPRATLQPSTVCLLLSSLLAQLPHDTALMVIARAHSSVSPSCRRPSTSVGMARTIKTEVGEQNGALDSLQSDMLDVDGRLKKANRSMRRL
jgi:hypothetical protein